MKCERIICFVDGFNLYHALHAMRQPHLKWLDLRKLSSHLIHSKSQEITQILYFSAFPIWKPDTYRRHRQYMTALSISGVTLIFGQFKTKPKQCLKCRATRENYEEKESDVNFALALLDLAYKNMYDHAFVLTRDSDIAPAIHKVKQNFPDKKITVLSIFNCRPSSELLQVADAYKTIKLNHITASLFPAHLYDSKGNLVVERPLEYIVP